VLPPCGRPAPVEIEGADRVADHRREGSRAGRRSAVERHT
jgi:hypothetical protein